MNFLGYFQDANSLLYIIGLCFIFKKCNVKQWWSFVPVARYYKLVQCTDMEDDALGFVLSHVMCNIAGSIVNVMQARESKYANLVMIISFCLFIGNFVYTIRVSASLCRLFGRNKKWIWLWLFADGFAASIWGCNPKFQPVNLAGREDAALEKGKEVPVLEKGLTVNINSRTVFDHMKKKTLLKDIHLNIEPGSMVLLLGGSGAGKTTFLNAITGYEQADARIYLDGIDVYENYGKVKNKIGFVPQQDLIRYKDTVMHTVKDSALLKTPKDIEKAELNSRIDNVLDVFGLIPVQDNIVAKQSGGQKKRISIAMEFVADPSLFILDEPDSGLDGVLARDLMKRLRSIADEGKIVIVITHTPDRVLDLFDKVIVLAKDANRSGRLVYYGSVDKAKKFFERDTMEGIVKSINRKDEGGDGLADSLIEKFEEASDEQ